MGQMAVKKKEAIEHYQGDAGQKYYEQCQANRSWKLDKHKADFLSLYIKPTDTVLDFGCGRGRILSYVPCAKRYGLEINPVPAADARDAGLEVFNDPADIPEGLVDVVMSNHCLEHIINVHEKIADFKRILKPGGRVVLVVPAENPGSRFFKRWKPHDMDQHLYSWTPLSFGNLVQACGFEIEEAYHKTLGYSRFIEFLFPLRPLYDLGRWLISIIKDRYELVVVARMPNS